MKQLTSIGVNITTSAGFYVTIPKGKPLRCATCGKFMSSTQIVWYSPIENMPREPYHSDCPKP